MSANQSSKTASDSDNSAAQNSSMDGTNLPLASSSTPAQSMTPEPTQPKLTLSESMPEPPAAMPQDPTGSSTSGLTDSPTDSQRSPEAWEAVDLPGTVLDSPSSGPSSGPSNGSAAIAADRENELLTLIHDLNKCNDALLARVFQLETALNDSHQVLHNEAEKAKAVQSKMVEQVSMQQASTQQISQTAQQQIAKLVDQLETAEQSFERQQLINETLLSELGNAQERVAQLEHECALSAQQHAEEVQAKVKSETTIRDLRSRLHRQQRYTLQFKAALEKSLTVTTRSTADRTPQPISQSMTQPIWDQSADLGSSSSVSMPKAQRIMPWAGAITSPFEGIDPHLENLIRGANQPSLEPAVSLESAQPEAADIAVPGLEALNLEALNLEALNLEALNLEDADFESADNSIDATDTEAESQLWQDIERVIDQPVIDEPVVDDIAEDDIAAIASSTEAPKFNWQQTGLAQTADAAPSVSSVEKKVSDLPSIVIDPYTVSVDPASDTVGFTEPSPWGTAASDADKPSATQSANQKADQDAGTADQEAASSAVSSVAPAVNALRNQKRLNALSSVQLPTFEKAKAGSFRR